MVLLCVVVLQLRALTAEVHEAHRQTDYWRSVAFAATDQDEGEDRAGAGDQDDWTDSRPTAQDKKNPKEQGWRLWYGRKRNQQKSEVSYHHLDESKTRRRPSEHRLWTRR